MRTAREFYIRHDFSFFDSGLLALISPQILILYDLLRRFVWRADNHANPLVRTLRGEGKIVAMIRQGKLAETLGYSDTGTICRNLAVLKRLGWVQVETDLQTTTTVYILGQVLRDGEGGKHEVFFADAILGDLVERLDAEAERQFGPDASFQQLPYAERVTLAKKWVKGLDPEESVTEGGMVKSTGGVWGNAQRGDGEKAVPNKKGPTDPKEGPEDNKRHRANPGGPPAPQNPPAVESRVLGEYGKVGVSAPSQTSELNPQSTPRAHTQASASEPKTQTQTPPKVAPPPLAADVEALIARKAAEYKSAATAQAGEQLHQEGIVARREGAAKGAGTSRVTQATLQALERLWRERMEVLRPGVAIAVWGVREKTHVAALVKAYNAEVVAGLLRYVTGPSSWADINARLLKGKSTQPTISMIHGYHETLAAESQALAPVDELRAEVDRWYAEHPDEPLPSELAERYRKAGA